MAAEGTVTFANFRFGQDSVYDIGNGVVPEVAGAFDYKLSPDPDIQNLGGLIGTVAPEKELQKNIAFAKEVLGPDSLSIARDWAGRTALLGQVRRAYMSAETALPWRFKRAGETDGVRNWMFRRGQVLAELAS